jgi:putative flavoprotein involved in K+ transport
VWRKRRVNQRVGCGESAPIVVGAGPAGLSAAYALSRLGITARILERSDRVCDSWHNHYESLELNTARFLSQLPGARLDRSYDRWVPRDQFIAYVQRYAKDLAAEIEFGTTVRRVDRHGEGWLVETSHGALWSPHVIIATGLNTVPYLPSWPGRDTFDGELIHAIEYRNAKPFRGRRVLLVGMGQTGSDLSVELLRGGVGSLQVSIRTPPIILPRWRWVPLVGRVAKRVPPLLPPADALGRVFHRALWGPLARHGLPQPPRNRMITFRQSGAGRVSLDQGFGVTFEKGLLRAVKRGEAEFVAAVERFDGPDVVLADGGHVTPDVVIAATGRRTGLAPLVGHLGVLGPDQRPAVHGGHAAASAPGLYFLGFRLPPGQLPDLRPDSRAIARSIARSVRSSTDDEPPATLAASEPAARDTVASR